MKLVYIMPLLVMFAGNTGNPVMIIHPEIVEHHSAVDSTAMARVSHHFMPLDRKGQVAELKAYLSI